MDHERTSVLIIGGGISGLSTAWFLRAAGTDALLIEAGDEVGGVIATHRADGYLVEGGPNSTLQRSTAPDDALSRIVRGTGLSTHLTPAREAAQKRFVLKRGALRPLPASPAAFLATPLFSSRAKLRLLREPFVGRARGEESIARFVERRLGREFLDYAVEPFISGVYAGDPARLSVRAAVPRVYELERRFGSLLVGAVATGKGAKGAGGPAGRLVSFNRGMAMLPRAVAAALPPGTCRTGRRVIALRRSHAGWEVRWEGASRAGVVVAGRVVLAVPAPEAANLLAPLSPEAARILDSIPYAPVVSLALGYGRGQVGHPLDGFGFLAPRREGLRILGSLFSSTLFEHRAPDGGVLVTAFMGGSMDAGAVEKDDEALVRQAHGDLRAVLDIQGDPAFARISRHARAIPQYTLGHGERMARLDRLLAEFPGLHLQASWRGGVSVADCIRSGAALAGRLHGAAREATVGADPHVQVSLLHSQ